MNFKFKTRKRRGLSSVIGALFFIVLMIATFAALLAAFSYQNDLVDTQKSITDLQVAKAQENFVVTTATTSPLVTCNALSPNDKCLDVIVNNKGTNTVEIAKLWVIEKVNGDGDLNSYEAEPYDTQSTPALDFNDLIVPVGTSKLITTDLIPVNSADADGYRIKVVSKLGTIVTADFPEVGGGPQGDDGLACWDLNEDGIENYFFPDPPYTGGIFTLDGFDFTTEDRDASGDINTLDCIGAPGGGNEIVIELGLLNKPEIFMMFPSPFGEVPASSDAKGQWGAIVANPSENTMTVKKIVITAILTGASSSETAFPTGGGGGYNANGCPTGTSLDWYCGKNQLVWKGSPADILTRSAQSFIVPIRPDIGVASNQNGMPVFASVLTSYGQFGKTAYLSSLINSPSTTTEEPIVNVYHSPTTADSETDVAGDFSAQEGVPFSKFFTISETSADTSAGQEVYVKSGTQLIINIPRGFTGVSGHETTTGTFVDGSDLPVSGNVDDGWQIVAELDTGVNLGDTSSNRARSIQVSATPPALDPPGFPKLYAIYVLADGKANYKVSSGSCPDNCGEWDVGALGEIILQVTP